MRLEARKYLYDIQRAVELLEEFTSGKTFGGRRHVARRGGARVEVRSHGQLFRDSPGSRRIIDFATSSTATEDDRLV